MEGPVKTPTVTSESVLQSYSNLTLSANGDSKSVHFGNDRALSPDLAETTPILPPVMPAPPSSTISSPDDRKNEYYAMKRFIFLSFGVPGGPAMDPEAERCITFFSIPFYFILAVWGVLLMSLPVMEDNYIWKRRCPAILTAKVFTVLAGVFFIALGIYWIALFSWSRCYIVRTHAHNRNFTPMAFSWWLLTIYFGVVVTGLIMEICKHRDLILSHGDPKDGNYVECKGTNKSKIWDDSDFLYVPTNSVAMWALCSMLLLMMVHACIFIANARKLHRLSRDRISYTA